MKNYLPPNFKKTLSEAIGCEVNITYEEDYAAYRANMLAGNYEAGLLAASMSYKVLTEAINLLYTATPIVAHDPTGKVRSNLKEYAESFDVEKDEKFINNILNQMTDDAEIIPFAYVPGTTFYNKEKLDVSDIYFEESMQLWRLKQL